MTNHCKESKRYNWSPLWGFGVLSFTAPQTKLDVPKCHESTSINHNALYQLQNVMYQCICFFKLYFGLFCNIEYYKSIILPKNNTLLDLGVFHEFRHYLEFNCWHNSHKGTQTFRQCEPMHHHHGMLKAGQPSNNACLMMLPKV